MLDFLIFLFVAPIGVVSAYLVYKIQVDGPLYDEMGRPFSPRAQLVTQLVLLLIAVSCLYVAVTIVVD